MRSDLNLQIASYLDHCRNVRRLSPHTIAAYANDLAQFAVALAAAAPKDKRESPKGSTDSPEPLRGSREEHRSDSNAPGPLRGSGEEHQSGSNDPEPLCGANDGDRPDGHSPAPLGAAKDGDAFLAPPLSSALIRAALARIAEDKRLAPRTVKRRIAAIHAFLRAAHPHLATAVFAAWKLALRVPASLPRHVPKPELKALLQATESEEQTKGRAATQLCLKLLAATGLRVSELCALTIGSLDPGAGQVMVRGKGARERVVMIVNADLRKALAAHIRALPDADEPARSLFRNSRGRALTPQCLRLRLHALARRARIGRRITPHMMRHTAATLLLEGGVDVRFVQRLLGHASIATTQIYTHVSDQALRSALARADVMRALI